MTRTVQELQNTAVMAGFYSTLFPNGVGRENGINKLLRETVNITSLRDKERQTVAEATEKMTKVITNTPSIGIDKNIREYKGAGWDVNSDNMEDEFKEVERRTFCDGVHWGRVIAFMAFSVSFAAYVTSLGINGGAESVFRWTNNVLDKNLADFIKKENGWVSECMFMCDEDIIQCRRG